MLMLNHIKNNVVNSHFYKIIWHIANYILTLQPFLTNIYIIMKQKNLISIDDADLIYMNWFLEYLLTRNKKTYLFSRTEESIIKRWQQQIKKAI